MVLTDFEQMLPHIRRNLGLQPHQWFGHVACVVCLCVYMCERVCLCLLLLALICMHACVCVCVCVGRVRPGSTRTGPGRACALVV